MRMETERDKRNLGGFCYSDNQKLRRKLARRIVKKLVIRITEDNPDGVE